MLSLLPGHSAATTRAETPGIIQYGRGFRGWVHGQLAKDCTLVTKMREVRRADVAERGADPRPVLGGLDAGADTCSRLGTRVAVR